MNTQTSTELNLTESKLPIEYRLVTSPEDLEKIYRLRYKIFCEEMGRDLSIAQADRQHLSDSLDPTADHIGAFRGNQLIGCMRVNYSERCRLPDPELFQYERFLEYPNQKIALVGKIVVDHQFRGLSTFFRLCVAANRAILLNEGTYVFTATVDRLLPLFRKLGFRETGNRYESWADYGSSNPMVLDVRDVDHLRRSRSPLIAAYEERENAA